MEELTRPTLDSNEMINGALEVRFGTTWYKLVGSAIGIGAAVGVGVYLVGRTMFRASFRQTRLVIDGMDDQ